MAWRDRVYFLGLRCIGNFDEILLPRSNVLKRADWIEGLVNGVDLMPGVLRDPRIIQQTLIRRGGFMIPASPETKHMSNAVIVVVGGLLPAIFWGIPAVFQILSSPQKAYPCFG